jgi:uncharacterized Tic20 family protein
MSGWREALFQWGWGGLIGVGRSLKMSAVTITAAPPHAQAFAFEQQPFAAAPHANANESVRAAASNDAGANAGAGGEGSASATATRSIGQNGRLREDGIPDAERTYTTVMHLSPLAFLWIGPLALGIPLTMWLMRKDKSHFTDDHGREIANFAISWVVLSVGLVWTVVVPIALTIVAIISVIRGAMAASRNEYFRYPMTVRFL